MIGKYVRKFGKLLFWHISAIDLPRQKKNDLFQQYIKCDSYEAYKRLIFILTLLF